MNLPTHNVNLNPVFRGDIIFSCGQNFISCQCSFEPEKNNDQEFLDTLNMLAEDDLKEPEENQEPKYITQLEKIARVTSPLTIDPVNSQGKRSVDTSTSKPKHKKQKRTNLKNDFLQDLKEEQNNTIALGEFIRDIATLNDISHPKVATHAPQTKIEEMLLHDFKNFANMADKSLISQSTKCQAAIITQKHILEIVKAMAQELNESKRKISKLQLENKALKKASCNW